ncbi:PREDICTED: uncharacterized protein At5g50100, mitochondrial [Nicotiana attenuata]|uniref:Uncharacterized protein, mitochondrial n=1 Tax=Nicotiana attenuata TaxID=49451 RepID=A0A1J6J4W1_NICAT|nr:PREDICTED: uncharacterized protein At5g50100, mitochondrial [Nicotiana attenuata]OIT04911.1 uncharacterized protein, mitochondrial [Nicotiana attenuata]
MQMALRVAARPVVRRANIALLSLPHYLTTKSHAASSSSQFLHNSFPPLNQNGPRYSIRAISGTTVDPVAPKKDNAEQQSPENWKIKMLYDGDCPLCMREVDMLKERNKVYGTIKFVDISSDEYSPEENEGLDYKTVMGTIHAILSDGTVVTNVEIATIADTVYGVWAKYRLQITGRPPLEEVILARKNKEEMCKDNKACKI